MSIKSFIDKLLYVKRNVREHSNVVVARGLLEDIVTDQDFPYQTGKLRSGGYAYYRGKLVAQATDFVPAVNTSPPGGGRAFSQAKGGIVIEFTAAKPASPGAKTFYMDTGGKKFDYAEVVHEGGPYNTARKYIESHMSHYSVKPKLIKAMRELWSTRA